MPPPEKKLLNRLSVFRGGWTLEAAEEVCSGEGVETDEVLDLLTQIVNKSMVVVEDVSSTEEVGGETRYRLLETVRGYGLERLAENGEEEVIKQHHASFYLTLAEEAEPGLHGPDQVEWLGWLKGELDNLRAALGWNKSKDNFEAGLRLAGTLWWFWHIAGIASEGREWLEGMLRNPAVAEKSGVSASVLGKALASAGILAGIQGDFDRAVELCKDALVLFQGVGDKKGMGMSLTFLGAEKYFRGEFEPGRQYAEQGLALSRETGDKWLIATSLRILGIVMNQLGDYTRAMELLEESLAVYREIGDKLGVAYLLRNMGLVPLNQGDYERAAALCEQSLTLSQELGDKWSMAWALEELGIVAILGRAQPERAARIFGIAESFRKEAGTSMPLSERALYERGMAAVRDELDEEAFTAAWAEGQAMSMEAAVEYALEEDENV